MGSQIIMLEYCHLYNLYAGICHPWNSYVRFQSLGLFWKLLSLENLYRHLVRGTEKRFQTEQIALCWAGSPYHGPEVHGDFLRAVYSGHLIEPKAVQWDFWLTLGVYLNYPFLQFAFHFFLLIFFCLLMGISQVKREKNISISNSLCTK